MLGHDQPRQLAVQRMTEPHKRPQRHPQYKTAYRVTSFLDARVLGSSIVREVNSLFQAIEKEGLYGGKTDNNKVGRPRHMHDPGIQQEPTQLMTRV